MTTAVTYTISIADLHAHQLQCHLRIENPKPVGQQVFCPRWIPGSYLLRDFAKHILSIRAVDTNGKTVTLNAIDNSTWELGECAGPVEIILLTWAWDLSVRGAYVDQYQALINPITLCLGVEGQLDESISLILEPIAEKKNWSVSCALPSTTVDEDGFGCYQAHDYHTLVDTPITMGEIVQKQFSVGGKQHTIALTGDPSGALDRLAKDVETICKFQQRWMGAPALDFTDYTFLCHFTENTYGGLEHRACTSLMAPRHFTLGAATDEVNDNYSTLLALFSHEYFHNWFIKRIRPEVFSPYQYDKPCLTEQLWIFEGFTSYYDDLNLVRAGVIGENQYLSIIQKNLTRYLQAPSREKQTIMASSYDTWFKFYQPNENTNNAVVSYYLKGGLICMCLDALLHESSDNKLSLDILVRQLWQQYHNKPVPEGAIEDFIAQEGGAKVKNFLRSALHTTDPLPIESALKYWGLSLDKIPLKTIPKTAIVHGMRLEGALIKFVANDSVAEQAGLAPGDTLIAINGLRYSAECWNRLPAGKVVQIQYCRQGRQNETVWVTSEPAAWEIQLKRSEDSRSVARRMKWLYL